MTTQPKLSHVIVPGDSLYKLARTYQTTVPSLLAENPDAAPYNLRIGQRVTVCPGPAYGGGAALPMPLSAPPTAANALSDEMRRLWQEHVMWTRMLILTIVDGLGGEDAVTQRLTQNPADLGALFAQYYGKPAGDQVARLIAEHLDIGKALFTDAAAQKAAETAEDKRRWYENASEMAQGFKAIEPLYDERDLEAMLYRHLDLTIRELAARQAKNYPLDVQTYDDIAAEAYEMADFFTDGIARRAARR
ncbi:MAG: LysM peptidoglycan-binding domain-containing protein [Oscillospiraceae bacterium]|jgi:hypothetical protein|nr:LysM peptidoglycan-binding domain-containing protein [Oscillospiraceae bacterium]